MRSLTLKLIVAFVGVAALSILVLVVLVNRSTSTEFASYLEHIGRMQGMMGGGHTGGMMGNLGDAEQQFLADLRHSLWWAGLVTIGLALLLGLLLARQIVLPLRRLTLATRQLAAGNLNERVQIASRDEIGEVARAFNGMAENLAKNESLRRNMIADIAHELRTPLAILQGELEAMQDRVVEASPAKLSALHDEVLRLSRLVSDLRTLSLAEAGQLEFHLGPADAAEVVRQVAAGFETAAASKHVSIDIQTGPPTADSRLLTPDSGLPTADRRLPTVMADADRLAQVVRNLLDNALRYSPEGSRIQIGLAPEPDHLLFSINDSGPGIAEKDLPHIFERFYRADPSRSHATGGSGIGLTIVKQLVERQGGKVWATSQVGKGTTFHFTLPRFRP